MIVKITDLFQKSFLKYLQNRKWLWKKLFSIKVAIEDIDDFLVLQQQYNIVPLAGNYFRLKIPPSRIIFQKVWNEVIFVDFIKRKGNADYKKYS